MHRSVFLLFIMVFISGNFLFAQKGTGKLYRIDRYKSIYLPLGKISFADKLIEYNVGTPPPIQKYRDSMQCLHEPDYKNYQTPNFISTFAGSLDGPTSNRYRSSPGRFIKPLSVNSTVRLPPQKLKFRKMEKTGCMREK